MAAETLCRLCVTICQDFRELYDENGLGNEVYQLMIQYFDSTLFFAHKGKELSVMCSRCWQRISDFSIFQQSVLQAQKKLLENDFNVPNAYYKSEPGQYKSGLRKTLNIKKEKMDDVSCSDTSDLILPDDTEHMYENDTMSELGESEEQLSSDEEASMSESEEESKTTSNAELKYSCKDKTQKELEKLKKSDETIARWKPFLACLMCSKACATLTILQKHFQEAHVGAEFYVLCCKRRLRERSKIEKHMIQHIDPQRFKCDFCDLRFRSRSSYTVHRMKKHNEQKPCRSIRKSRKESDDLIAKWKTNLECYVCKEKRPTLTLLREHFSEEHPLDEAYVFCCSKKMKDRNRIEEHAKVHVDPSAFKCEICNKCFKMRWYLINHMRRIHGEENEKQTVGDCFPKTELPDTAELMQQKQTTPQKKNAYLSKMGCKFDDLIAQWKPNLQCVMCGVSYVLFSLLEKHFRSEHPGEDFYIKCCQLKLNRQHRILEHARYHSDPNVFKCDECGKILKTKNALNMHMTAQHREKIKI